MVSNLSRVFQINKYLQDIKYPDSYRISKEIDIYLKSNLSITKEEILKRISNDEPWEYIKGECEFCNNIFKVNRYTLIPRIETEQIVYDCKKILEENEICNIIDIGTGSGSILISLIHLIKDITPYSFTGTDISKKALDVAKKNEESILKSKIVNWVQCNLIREVPNIKSNSLLIANLPYIPTSMYMNLDRSVREYEPEIALNGGTDGLKYYRELFTQIQEMSIYTKYIYLETEESIFENTKSLVMEFFPKANIKGIKDCFQKDRFLLVSFP